MGAFCVEFVSSSVYRQCEEARVPVGRERGVILQRVESQWGRQAGTCV